MKRSWNMFKSLFLIMLLVNVCIISSMEMVFADGKKDEKNVFGLSNYETFAEEGEECKNIKKKVQAELENVTGLISYETEEYLNRKGIFDEEIEDISNIQELDEVGVENIEIFTEYFAVSDTPEEQNKSISNNEMEILEVEEVDALFGNEYFGEDNEVMSCDLDKKDENIIDKVLVNIGIKPMNVYGVVKSEGGGNISFLKKTVIITSMNVENRDCVHVICTSKWTTMPKYRNIDVITLAWSGAMYVSALDDYNYVEQRWDEETHSCMDGNKIIINRKYKNNNVLFFDYYADPKYLKKGQFFINENGCVAVAKLHEDTNNKILISDRVYDEKVITNERIIIDIYLKKKSGYEEFIVYPYYEHFKSDLNVQRVITSLALLANNLYNGDFGNSIYVLTSGMHTSSYATQAGIAFDCRYTYK